MNRQNRVANFKKEDCVHDGMPLMFIKVGRPSVVTYESIQMIESNPEIIRNYKHLIINELHKQCVKDCAHGGVENTD